MKVGQFVFVPGARCFGEVRGLFGGAAARVVVPASRVTPIDERLGERGVLLALAATAYHALASGAAINPDLIVGHGVLGRLLARVAVALGSEPPVVWETNRDRADGAVGYAVVHPDEDTRRDYRAIYDVSGDASLLDTLDRTARAARRDRARRVLHRRRCRSRSRPHSCARRASASRRSGEPEDLVAVKALAESGRLSLDGLITHREEATRASSAYRTAFEDSSCLKMILDWRACS